MARNRGKKFRKRGKSNNQKAIKNVLREQNLNMAECQEAPNDGYDKPPYVRQRCRVIT
jgi:hypothetical protein